MTWLDPVLFGSVVALVAAAWLTPKAWQGGAMMLVGVLFLVISDPQSLFVLVGLGLLGQLLTRGAGRGGWRAAVAAAAVAAVLIHFKLGLRLGDPAANHVVPLGLSFYGLRIIHFVFESTQGRLERHGVLAYWRYLFFLPTFVAGPINRFPGFVRDSRRRRWDGALFAIGLERILYGFVKIVVLANWLVVLKLGSWGAGLGPPDSWSVAYLGCVTYGLNLYLQFAGYSDVAIGLALLVGFRVPENFRWPFAATNIHDFWQRWHITLSHWCRDYVFRPVASLSRSPYLGVVASMLVLGLWHELSWRYFLWGLYHGLGLVAWRLFGPLRDRLSAVHNPWVRHPVRVLSWTLTLNFVIFSFALTSADTLGQTWEWWRVMLTFGRW